MKLYREIISSNSPAEEDESSKLQVEWWRILDWNEMKRMWKTLPEETKNLIREAGLAPRDDKRG